MTAKVIGTGQWKTNDRGILMTTVFHANTLSTAQQHQNMWSIGQIVDVRPRTWAGINRPGGTGRITNIHYADQDNLHSSPVVIGLDVKYSIYTGQDLHLDPELVKPHVELESRGRRRAPAAPVVPAIESENILPSSKSINRESKNSMRKRHAHVAPKKGTGSASKSKLSLSGKIGLTVRRKRLQVSVKSTRTPKCATCSSTKMTATESSIPQEIVFNSSSVSNTPNSGCSKRATSLGSCSPLGEDGVENQLQTTASYDCMMQPLRPSVGTSNAHCPISTNNDNDAISHNEDMDFDIVELRISPCTQTDTSRPQSCINATPLASGCFSKELKHFTDGATHFIAKREEEKFEKVRLSNNNDVVDRLMVHESAALRAHPTLGDVYDNEVKKASQFIRAVVQGRTNEKSGGSAKNVTIQENRLNHFRSLLSDYLSDSDGMIEFENLASKLCQFAKSSSDDVFDYTEYDVHAFVSELCAQNKIMLTEGWIYNI